jgi:NAD(P)-dependent dehydrogenase (short-subunit alcohol dehydrogenase family)
VILITGAGDGIGRAVSLACAAHGATLVLLGRTVAKLESVYDDIVAAGGPKPAIYPMELEGAVPDDHRQLAQRIDSQLGRLDGLLHNAGLLGSLTPLEHYDPLEWLRVIQVNLHAPFLLTQACLALLRRAPDASLLFTSSGVGRRGRAYWGAYSASKFALEGMMQILADELHENTRIRVNSINPGRVRTAMRAAAYPAENPAELLAPEDIVLPYLYLLGPDSHGVHGQALDAQ